MSLQRVFLIQGIVGVALGMLLPVSAVVIDRKFGKTVRVIVPHSAEMVAVNQWEWAEAKSSGQKTPPVENIYGLPSEKPIRLMNPPAQDLIVPAEDPRLTLYVKGADKNPLQMQTIFYAAKMTAAPSFVVGVLGFVGWAVKKRKRGPQDERPGFVPPGESVS